MNNKNALVLIIFLMVFFGFLSLASAAINISSCSQNINASGSYVLNQSITSSSTCLTTNSSNVEIDCAGNTITYGTSGANNLFGISALHPTDSQVNLTIKNCIIIKTSVGGSGGNGIMLTRFANSTITNNTIRTNGTSGNKGIYILTGSAGNNVSRNTIVTSGSSTSNYGIYLYTGTSDSLIEYNNITTGKGAAATDNYGIRVDDPRANITGNTIYTFGSGDSNHGIYSYTSTSARIINNTVYTSGTTGNNIGIFVSTADYNYIANNTINTTGPSSPGIYLTASGLVNVLNNKINSTADGVYITSTGLGDFTTANITRDNTRFGRNITFYGGGTANLPCPNNQVLDNPSDGGLKFISCNNVTVQNWYRPNRDTDTLLFVNSDNNKIINNTLNGGIHGLAMLNSIALCDNNLVENNTFSSFGYLNSFAIVIYGSYNTVTRNNLSTNGIVSGNIALNINGDYENITNNIITTSGTSGNIGIDFGVAANYNLIQNNTITTSGTSGNSGIYFESTNVGNIIRNNTVTATGTTSGNLGIRLVTNSNNNLIEYNTFYTKGLTSGNNGMDLSSSSNNTFRFNNVYAGSGVGTTDNDAISMVSSRNNTFLNNILFANGTATSITSSSIFLQSNSANNTFANNIITKSVGNAIELDFLTTYPNGNTFQNNSLNNVSGSDLFFLDASINDTILIDQPIGKYNFTGLGGTISLENTQFGKIVFLSPINGSNGNLTDDIQIRSNFVQVNSSKSSLNASANISFYNLATNFYIPLVKRDGVFECNYTTTPSCINLTSLNAGNVSFSVSGWSNYSIVNGTDTIPPSITIVSPQNITYLFGSVFLNYTASDNLALGTCKYSINGLSNITLPGCSTATIVGLADGSHFIKVYVNDTTGNTNSDSVYFTISSNPPQSSNIQSSTPLNYSYSTLSLFNITWASSNSVSTVLFESNFSGVAQNYSMYYLGGNVYGFNASIPAGTFYWKSYANDSYGNVNLSSVQTFTIGKSTPFVNIVMDGLSSDLTVGYGNQTNVTSVETNLGDADVSYNFYRDSQLISSPEVSILNVGVYGYVYNSTMSQNYSSNSITRILTVNKATPALSLYLNGIEGDNAIFYGNTTGVSVSNPLALALSLTRDGVEVSNGQSPSDSSLLASGSYNYSLIFVGSQNYNSRVLSYILTVNKATPNIHLTLNGQASDISLSVNQLVEINASDSSQNVVLYEDGILAGNSSLVSVSRNYTSVGDRVWLAVLDESQNYTSRNLSRTITVLDADVPQFSNLRTSPDSPAVYSSQRNYQLSSTWTDNIAVDDVIINFNGINYSYSSGQIQKNQNEYSFVVSDLAAGTYSYRGYANDTSGNMVSTAIQTYVIDKATTSLFLTMSPSSIVTYGTLSSVGCSSSNPETSTILTRNSQAMTNPDSSAVLVGAYNYACTSAATQNYTSASTSGIFIINKANPVIRLTLNGQSNDISFSGGVVNINANLTSPSSGALNLTVNNQIINSGLSPLENTTLFSTVGSYSITASYGGNENYTSGSATRTVTVTSTTVIPPTTGSSGGGGGGGGSSVVSNTTTGAGSRMEISSIKSIVYPGEEKSLQVVVKNKGITGLNKCKIVPSAGSEKWIESKDIKNIGVGEIVEFNFVMDVPSDNSNTPEISVVCLEGSAKVPLTIVKMNPSLNVEISKIDLKSTRLDISYNIGAGAPMTTELVFRVLDSSGKEIAKKTETIDVTSQTVQKNVLLDISNAKTGGELKILVLRVGEDKPLLEDSILYNPSTITGFASGALSGNGPYITTIVMVFLISSFFIVRKIIRLRREKYHHWA